MSLTQLLCCNYYFNTVYHLTLFDILQSVLTDASAGIVNNPVFLDFMDVCVNLPASVTPRSVITWLAVLQPMVLFFIMLFIVSLSLLYTSIRDLKKITVNKRKSFTRKSLNIIMLLINNSNRIGKYMKSYKEQLIICFFS